MSTRPKTPNRGVADIISQIRSKLKRMAVEVPNTWFNEDPDDNTTVWIVRAGELDQWLKAWDRAAKRMSWEKMKILVTLPTDRNIPGVLILSPSPTTLEGGRRKISCLGKSDTTKAQQKGNPTRDPLRPFGDLPTGAYRGVLTLPGTPERSYGPGKRVLLVPEQGECLRAQNEFGRHALMIHGGDLHHTGKLRPTWGCLRLSNSDMAYLVAEIEANIRAGDSHIEISVLQSDEVTT